MAKNSDKPAGGRGTQNTGGMLTGFLAEEEHLDRRALLRLGTWGAASVGAVIIAVLANQSSIRLRHDETAAVDMARQSQQIQSVAKESQNETRRLASAIDTLNGDRDRLYARVTVLEQGLDSVTGSIARQNVVAAAPQATPPVAPPAPAAAPSPPAVAQNPAPAPAPVTAPVAAPAAAPEKPLAEVKPPQPPAMTVAAATPATSEKQQPTQNPSQPTTTANTQPSTNAAPPAPLMASKSMMGPPDPAAPKLIEPPTPEKTAAKPIDQTPAKTAAVKPAPEVVASAAPDEKEKKAPDAAHSAPPQIAVNRTEFGVDVGGANSVGGLRALWRGLLKSRSNAPLAALQPIIMIKESNNGLGMQLRLVAGPLNDAAAAAKICATISEHERPCETTVYDGQRLAMKAEDASASADAGSARSDSGKSDSAQSELAQPDSDKPPAAKPGSTRRYYSRHRDYPKKPAPVVEVAPPKPEPSTLSSFFSRR
ncbi:hypothetical protein [Bradyrhizobium canariense]|uniref:Uncharacterized protein n=1 Tax=Bradyrhizobium canariense TaxID=255045 RepID=A0A1H1Q6Z8_9BRAD|nr:hypothetical protein [Bradyrhizobium canariense]SDS19281.1 hypothetical protein SAMN05444158_1297 [Bradyrhizobium canariense]